MWKDSTSYRRGKDKVPTTFTVNVGQLDITATCGHIYYPGDWVMECFALNIALKHLGVQCKTASQAKQEVISIVRRTLDSLSKDAKEIELATAIQAIEEELGVKQQ